MRSNFEKCLEHVLRHEGGYVNDKRDPGGETNMGISKRSYPKEDIRNMTRARAAEIYRRDFWAPVRGDDLPVGVDLVAFDGAVNSGVSRGSRWVQTALGVTTDGKIGPATLAVANAMDPEEIINRACNQRLAFLRSLGTWGTFGKGWTRRVEDVRVSAIQMHRAAVMDAKAPAPAPVARPSAAPSTQTWLIIGAIGAAIAAFVGLR